LTGPQFLGARRDVWILVAYGLVNLLILLALRPAPNADWATSWWPLAGWGSAVYEHPWRYSPVLLPVAALVVAGGPWVLGAAHLVALAALTRLGTWMVWLVALSAFFWVDLLVGNVFTFVAVAGAFAVAGSRGGALIFLILTLLMPRPVQIPLAMWLLWRRAELRIPFAAVFGLHAFGVLASGLAGAWIGALFGSLSQASEPFALGPGRVLGAWWLVLGIPLAGLMVWRGSARVAALAGLVASPYLLPQHLLMAVIAVPQSPEMPRPSEAAPPGWGQGEPGSTYRAPGVDVGPRP
jgi:hypothetical protein